MLRTISKQECWNKLEEISRYEAGWNGCYSQPFNVRLINKCKYIIDHISIYPMIFPTADNSIQFEFSAKKIYVELEIFEDRYSFWVKINGKCAGIDLFSKDQVVDWWNALMEIAKC